MSENGLPESGLGTEFAKELARKLPVEAVYQEVVSPTAKQTGQLAADIVKTIQLALAPIQFLAAYQDRLRGFIDSAVRRVPEKRRVSPASQILGPVIEGIRYEPEGTPIDEMFSELLSRSVDRERAHEAHPNVPFYLEHLSQLGLADIFQQGNQEALWGNEPRVQVGIRVRCQYKLTDLGQRFVRACTAEKAARKEGQT